MTGKYVSVTINFRPEHIEEIEKTRISKSVYVRDLLDKQHSEVSWKK